MTTRTRWLALFVLCLGTLMIVLDTTIVNVALPSIGADLGFSRTGLTWVVDAYLLTFGGFLLLGGRLGDLYGARRMFVAGIALFTAASLGCGLSDSQGLLVVMRAVQGIGGAIAESVALALTMLLFQEPAERAKAMGIFGFVAAGGGSIGVLLGGVLTSALSWHWIFFVNVPIGFGVVALALRLLPSDAGAPTGTRLDLGGAITVTAALMLAVFAIVGGNDAGWTSVRTLGGLAGAVALLCVFVIIESRVAEPLMPLRLFRRRNLVAANGIGILWAAAMFAWFFLTALYMQQVLHYSAREVGLAFLPSNVIMAVLSVAVSARLVMRFGIRPPLVAGLLCAGAGLLLLSRAPVGGDFVVDILPAMVLLGIGAGIAFNPVLLAAMNDVDQKDSGIASGLVNTAFMMGGAVGLAVLASVAAARTATLTAGGAAHAAALAGGYHVAFVVGAIFALIAAGIGATVLRVAMPAAHGEHAEPHAGDAQPAAA